MFGYKVPDARAIVFTATMLAIRALLKNLTFWVLLPALWLPVRAAGQIQPDGYHLVRDCQEEWLVYSSEYKNYVPYVKVMHESEPSVSILINLVRDRHFSFLLKTTRSAFLFVNGALQRSLVPGQWSSVSCDSLYRIYGAGEVMLTVFGLRGTEGLTSLMVFPKTHIAADSIQTITPSVISLKPRSDNAFRDFSVIAWLLILVTGAGIFLSHPSIAYKLVSPVVFLSRDFRSELYNHYRAYSPVIVAAVILLALVTAFLLMAIEIYVVPVLPAVLSVSDRESVWVLVAAFLKITLLCFGLFCFKYFMITVTLGILNMSEVAHVHFIKAVQSSLLFYGALAVSLLLLIFRQPRALEEIGEPLAWCVIIYSCVRYILFYILLNPPGRIINLYLISYLCVVELIPLIIGIKFIM